MPAEPVGPADVARARHRRCPKCHGRHPEPTAFCPTDGTPLESVAGSIDDRTGDLLADRYRLVRLLGQGGMGQVYEAEHIHIDKRVAVKLLRREVVANDPDTITRFRQEARAASSIGHPAIIVIEDFAPLPDGSVYLAMELLRGASLADHLKAHAPLPVTEAIRIVIETARGLAAAHEAGIVHRDIKPENLFLCTRPDGPPPVKILDFGIAKVSLEGPSTLTQTGAVFGTPHYMSPEQALGRPVDARSDIYALGIIAYQLLAGDVPFQAESLLGVLNQHVQVAPRPLREVAPDRVSPELAGVVARALAKDPVARFPSMDDFAIALVAASAGRRDPTPGRGARSYEAIIPSPRAPLTAEVAPATIRDVAPARAYPSRRAQLLALGGGVVMVLVLLALVLRPRPPAPIVAPPPPSPPLVAAPEPPPPKRPQRREPPPSSSKDAIIDPYGGPSKPPLPAEPPRPHPQETSAPNPAREHHEPAPKGSDLDRVAAALKPGMQREGAITTAHADHVGDHTDVFAPLRNQVCYTILAHAKPGVEGLSLYLWDPDGNRVAERRDGSEKAALSYCAKMPGTYHLQAKITGGAGDYELGVYSW